MRLPFKIHFTGITRIEVLFDLNTYLGYKMPARLNLEDYEPLESTHIEGHGKDTPYILAIAFFAILAYPTQTEWEKRDKFVEAIDALRKKEAIKRHTLSKKNVSKKLTGLPNQQIDGKINRAQQRIRKRISAAEITNRISLSHSLSNVEIKKHISFRIDAVGKLRVKRTGSKKGAVSMTNFIDEYAADYGLKDSSHTMKSIWSSSIPVLHLAHALWETLMRFALAQNIGRKCAQTDFEWDVLFLIMKAHEWIYDAVNSAEARRISYPMQHGILPSQTVKLTFNKP